MMAVVLHLVRHDLRTHRHLLLAWVAIVVVHPLASLLAWPAIDATGVAVPPFLVASRLVLGAAAIATIVQADSPLDDRTFWRTRPVAARTMAAAKLVMGALFVAVPLLVVLVVARLLGIPAGHLPSTIAQVVVTDAAAVGLVLFLSARTRHVATMLIALLGTLLAGYVLIVAITETLRVPWVRQFYALGPPSPQIALPTMLAIVALVSWIMTTLVFLGERYRLRLLLLCATGVLTLAVIWFVPAARGHRPTPRFDRAPSISVDAGRVRAERLASGRVALFSEGSLTGLQPGDRARQYLLDGMLDTPVGTLPARESTDLRFLEGHPEPNTVLLGVLSDMDFQRLAGRPVRFDGRLTLEVSRTDVLGTLPVAAGEVLDAGDLRLRLHDVQPSVIVPANFRAVATADVTWTATWTQGSRLPLTQWWLRQGANRRFIGRFARARYAWLVLLPSLAQPFGWQHAVLTVPAGTGAPIDAESATIEIEEPHGPVSTQRPARVAFVVPESATAFDVGGAQR
jgi:hypothetical protein